MELQISAAILKLYLETFRCYPKWRTMCPDYTLPDVQLATELVYNTTLIKTRRAEYIFTFNQRTGFMDDIVAGVTAGDLHLLCDGTLVLQLGVSISESDNGKPLWRPRSVATYIEGKWVDELLGLASRQQDHERSLAELATKEQQKGLEALENWRNGLAVSKSHSGPRPRPWPAKRHLWSRLWDNVNLFFGL